MNTKNRLIEKLLKVAKKHKILTYPVLALVAVISVFSYFFNWSTGAGKRVVAIVMVMVMLVSQSYFLTSSATALVDTEETLQEQQELQKQSEDEQKLVDDSDVKPIEKTTEIEKTEAETTETADSSDDNDNSGVSTEESSAEVEPGDTDSVVDEAEVNDEDAVDEGTPQASSEDPEVVKEGQTVQYELRYSDGGSNTFGYLGISGSLSDGQDGNFNIKNVCEDAVTAINNGKETNENMVYGCYYLDGTWYSDTGCQNQVTDLTNVQPNTDGKIVLYAKRVLAKYRVTIYDAEGTPDSDKINCEVTGGTQTSAAGVYFVDVANPTITIKGTRTGYIFKGVTGDVNVASVDETAVSVTFSNDGKLQKTLTMTWQADKYNVVYAKGAEGTTEASQTYTQENVEYDSDASFLSPEQVGVAAKKGYKVLKWKIGSTEVETNAGIRAYQDSLYRQTVTLYPVYVFQGVSLNQSTVTFNYDTPDNGVTLIGSYDDGSEVASGEFRYHVDWNIDESTGIKVAGQDGTNGITISTTGPTALKEDGYNVNITITNTQTNEIYEPIPVKVIVNPCNLTLSAEGKTLTKTYDNSTDKSRDLDLTGFAATCNGKPIKSTITVSFDSAQYESKNAGKRNLILSNPTIYKDGVQINGNEYILNKVNGQYVIQGEIFPRSIAVVTTNTKPVIKTGEADPVEAFGIALDTEAGSNNAENAGFAPGEGIEQVIEGTTITYSTGRTDLLKEDVYKISAETSGISNYDIVVSSRSNAKATLTVEKDNPDNSWYQVNGVSVNPNWYYKQKVTISPTSKAAYYDTIRLSKDGENIWKEIGEIEEADKVHNQTIYIQLYNSTTNAQTAWIAAQINVDETMPELQGYSVTYSEGTESGKLDSKDDAAGNYLSDIFLNGGKLLDIGNFFKNPITVEVRYKDETSGLATLDCNGLTSGPVQFVSAGNDIYTATFKIPNLPDIEEHIGTIQFKAKDIAGNEETSYHELSYNGSNKWVIEADKPVVTGFKVMSGKDRLVPVVSGSEKYYSNCEAVLDVKDDAAGIFDVTWHVNGESTEPVRITEHAVKNTYQFTKEINNNAFPSEDGVYIVSATITDNAGNAVDTEEIVFKIDDEPPVVSVEPIDDNYQTKATIRFTISDDLSGVKVNGVGIKDPDGNSCEAYRKLSDENGVSTYELDTTKIANFKSGLYYIVAEDNAGNVNDEVAIDLSKISNDEPECPEVTFSPEQPDGENGWYTSLPEVTVKPAAATINDNVPVSTTCWFWTGENEERPNNIIPTKITSAMSVKQYLDNGRNHLWVEAEAENGNKCEHEYHLYDILIDQNGPDISEPELTPNGGSSITVSFKISDDVSGVDGERIKVKRGTKDFPNVTIEQQEDGSFIGIFEITETGDYSVVAYDLAGNETTRAAFTPMSMKINAVKNITDTSATLGALVIKGSYPIESASLSYRKLADSKYTTVLSETDQDENGNWSLSAVLDNLEPGTSYAYKVVASSEAKEQLEYEGYFRTLSDDDEGITISGTVRYVNPDSAKSVTVGLLKGKECIRAVEVEDTTVDNTFMFTNVPDGNYNVIATDGTYSKTIRVSIENNRMIYPENGRIDLVLSGKNTSVVITTDDTPDITADNMDSIFNDDTNVSSDELKLIEDGTGTVEFKLYATLMRVSSVSADEIAAMYRLPGTSNKVVGAYLDLSLYKIVTDAAGEVTTTRVKELGGGANVSVTIPLGDLAGKSGLEVIRIHQNGDTYTGSSLPDMDGAGNSTYTITTTQFSTYAVLHDPDKTPEEPATTESIKDGSSDPASDGNIHVTTENSDIEPDDKDDSNDPDDNKKPSSNSSVGSLRSSGSAKTGDTVPIAVLGGLMFLSFAGFVILKKKSKENEL